MEGSSPNQPNLAVQNNEHIKSSLRKSGAGGQTKNINVDPKFISGNEVNSDANSNKVASARLTRSRGMRRDVNGHDYESLRQQILA